MIARVPSPLEPIEHSMGYAAWCYEEARKCADEARAIPRAFGALRASCFRRQAQWQEWAAAASARVRQALGYEPAQCEHWPDLIAARARMREALASQEHAHG